MKELFVKFVVESVEVDPPGVIVRVQRRIKQQYGRQSQLASYKQSQLVPDCVVQQNHTHHGTRPQDQRAVVHVEVNVLISDFVYLVRSCNLYTVCHHSCNPVLYTQIWRLATTIHPAAG